MADVPVPGFRKYWTQKLASLTSECHAITNKHSETASVVQQVYRVLSDTENLARSTLAKVGGSSEWTSIGKSAEENTANFCIRLDGKPPFSTLYSMYMVTLSRMKDICKVSALAGLSDAVNTTSVESMGQDDSFHEVKKCKRHIPNNTSQTTKKLNKPVPTSAAVRLPPK
jgi:hypothetical protein